MEKAYLSSQSSSSSLPNAHMSIGAHCWLVAEQSAQGILSTIQPMMVSEYRRNCIIVYLQSLIRQYFGTEVLPFGSVPLKTYLPHGDIDLTVVCHQNTEDDLARDLCNFLACEEQKDTEFVIKNVDYIHAQVKVVKCTVQDIAVDISFNQIAGLGALCFLEQVDRLIGKDHLFKQSIILIKAWCYYESRTLGALHGLISTYALDLLVLHILNLFDSSLNGPLSVLYRFLNYYSTFDWDKYCVSLNGPVAIASLPDMVETPQNDGSEFLFGQKFLKDDTFIFLLSTLAIDNSKQSFPVRHLNIIDALKGNNNLGRSVHKASFYRIRSAFSYGAQKLRQIVSVPQESIGDGLKNFFVNTLNRNGMGRRPDVRVPFPVFGTEKTEILDLTGDYNSYFSNLLYAQQYHNRNPSIQSRARMSPSEGWNESAGYQLSQNFVSCRNTESFASKPLCHPTAQLSYAASCDEESMKSQGISIYIPPVSVDKKLKSQGRREKILSRKSWGTGSFIPNIDAHSSDLMHSCGREVDAGQATQGLMLEPYLNNKQGNISSEVGESRSCLDLSLEEFPFLPCTKKVIPSVQPTRKTPQTQKPSAVSESIKFGSQEPFKLSGGKQPDFSSSTSKDSKPPETSEGLDEMVQVQPYKLDDDKDFPPLSS